jgi:lipid-A-disaccharide synthase
MVKELERLISGGSEEMIATFTELHKLIKCDADKQAALAVVNLIENKNA